MTVLEDLVERLHAHVARLTKSLNTHGDALGELKEGTSSRDDLNVLRRQMHSYDDQVSTLRSSVEALSHEINEVRMLVEGLVQKQQTPLPQSSTVAPEMPRSFKQQRSDPELQSTHTASLRPNSLHPAVAAAHTGYPYERPVSAPPMDTHHHHQQQPRPRREPATNDPELQRAEAILRSMPGQHQGDLYCSTCHHVPRHRYPAPPAGTSRDGLCSHTGMPRRRAAATVPEDEGFVEYAEDDSALPPQALLSRALRELEVDFSTHRK